MSDWRIGKPASLSDEALTEAVIARFQAIHDDCFADAPFANHGLGVELRALRHMEGWHVFLLLTPWMLSRMFLPERDPSLPIPDQWRSEARAGAPYVVIGPAIKLPLLGGFQQAHINHDAVLGHHLVQPLVQNMDHYASADAVFEAWNDVIAALHNPAIQREHRSGTRPPARLF